MIAEGRTLFERTWSPRNPQLGNDGLGPLFNGRSCVVCHNQGGVGGGGDASFNAKTIGIDQMQIEGRGVTDDIIRQAITGLHPGFVGSDGGILNTVALSHHGGSPDYEEARRAFMKRIPAAFSNGGGSVSADEVLQTNAAPVIHLSNVSGRPVAIKARLFQRNTPSLFGAGLIDQISEKTIDALVRGQKSIPEVSGRPATLPTGLYGRFGWRGNVASLLDFCDQACANELGLETDRLVQPGDPTRRSYQNPSKDISDSMIKSMASFIAVLPPPERRFSDDPEKRRSAVRGEQVFTSVGCAVCHVPDVGPAKGIYSDLLLHDMGKESYDLTAAEPHVKKFTHLNPIRSQSRNRKPARSVDLTPESGSKEGEKPLARSGSTPANRFGQFRRSGSRNTGFGNSQGGGGYGGASASVSVAGMGGPTSSARPSTGMGGPTSSARPSKRGASGGSLTSRGFVFVSPTLPPKSKVVSIDDAFSTGGKAMIDLDFHMTNVNQEWRTPPLWGVRDSAPYLHDGRAETLLQAIVMHEGEAAKTRDRFLMLSIPDRRALIEFLNTMVAPSTAPQLKL